MVMETRLDKTYTIEEFLNLPNDGKRYELVRGKLVEMAPTSRKHGKIGTILAHYLGGYVMDKKLGEVYVTDTGFTLDPIANTVREADLGFISAARLEGIPEDTVLPIPPDLAVEIVSPTDRLTEVEDKVDDWLEAGVKLVWVINPRPHRKVVYIYRAGSNERQTLNENDELDGGTVIPGFKLKVSKLFE